MEALSQYPNYRANVEAVICRNHKVLIMKRADHCAVAPGVWNVPAGKVKYDEVPRDAVVRECKEETGYDGTIVEELGVRAFKMRVNGEDAYRLCFTYLLEIAGDEDPILNDEHTEFAWVGLEELNAPKYVSFLDHLKTLIAEKVL